MRLFLITLMLGLASLLLAVPTAHADAVYRWVDEAGTVHFGSLPPDGVEAERIDIREPAGTAAQSAPGDTDSQAPTNPYANAADTPSLAQQKRAEREERSKLQREERNAMAGRCDAVRQQLAEVEPHTRVIVKDEDGGVRRMEDQERMDLIKESKAFIAANCE
jgi:hypothetical protein